MTGNYFCVRHKSKRTRNQHFKLLYFKLNSHFGKSNYISACRKLNLLLINSICLVVSFLEVQRKLIQYTTSFFPLSQKKQLTNLQKQQLRKLFVQCACYRYNLLRWMFFIPFDYWKLLLFANVRYSLEILSAAILKLSLKQVF